MRHSCPEQIELRMPEHLPLNQFQTPRRCLFVSAVLAGAFLARRHVDVVRRYPAGASSLHGWVKLKTIIVPPQESDARVSLSAPTALLISRPRFCGPSYPTRPRPDRGVGSRPCWVGLPRERERVRAVGTRSRRPPGRGSRAGTPRRAGRRSRWPTARGPRYPRCGRCVRGPARCR